MVIVQLLPFLFLFSLLGAVVRSFVRSFVVVCLTKEEEEEEYTGMRRKKNL